MMVESRTNKSLLYFTVPIVILMAICSSIGIWVQDFYARETLEWLSQGVGQDIANLLVAIPVLLISSYFVSKGSRLAKIIWIGTMMTNIYAYVIYSFAVHFNFLFHVYCLILGLSIYSALYFFITHFNENFQAWFAEKTPTKAMGIFLFSIAAVFIFLWLSESLPAAISNTVPESIINNGLITNPVQALDFSFYLPLMFIASILIVRKQPLGFLLAPMMLIFAILTNINIISLMIVTTVKLGTNNASLIIGFSVFTVVCFGFLWSMLRHLGKKA